MLSLSVYINILVTCSTLQCIQEHAKKFIKCSSLLSLSDLTFSAKFTGDPRVSHTITEWFGLKGGVCPAD